MMAAYQPQPGAMHPGMVPHGHPAVTPGQPMNPAMQQMSHPGVSQPGAPHVTQAGAMAMMQSGANGMGGPAGMAGQHPGGQMGGMPGQMGGQSMAGGAPNAHALSHLTPQAQMQQHQMMQQQIQQQQQQQHQQNPQMAMAQHQAMMQRRQAMAAMQAGNMGMQQAGIQGLNPQQLQALQQNSTGMHPQGVQLPNHLQLQQMQLHARQQQLQAAQNQQMQQQLAMQQANSQQSNQGAPAGPPNQQAGQQQQQQHPGQQMRPQSRMANPNEQNQGGPQQNAQQGTPNQQGQQQGQPNPQQPQQQNQQQGQQPQAQNISQMQAMQRQRQLQQMQLQQQQQNAMQRQMQAQQQQQQGGIYLLKVIHFGDQLSMFNSNTGKDMNQWHQFVDKNFVPNGRFVHSFLFDEGSQRKYHEIPRANIGRYFQTYFDTGATSIRLHSEHGQEMQMQPNRHQALFSRATFTVVYPNGVRFEMVGTLSVVFAPQTDLIEYLELNTATSEETIVRSKIEEVLSSWSPTMGSKQSPKMTKKNLPKAQQKMQADGLTIENFPKISKGSYGILSRVQSFLEISETMNFMTDLITFAQDRKLRPDQAIDTIIAAQPQDGQSQQGNPQINLPPNGIPAGQRTPSMQNMQMPNAQGNFSSPAMANLNLPMQNGIMNGSPHIANNPGLAPNMNAMNNSHTPSPHLSNMAAPQMIPQHSQQGTNSSAASANTSPQVNNKRRRSGVKLEEDGGGGEAGQGANKVKPSPRMGKKARPGAS